MQRLRMEGIVDFWAMSKFVGEDRKMLKVKVLLVDDNAQLRTILKEYFSRQEDIEVVDVAADGEAALEIIKKKEIDVVLLDIIMPQVDGFGVMEGIRQIDAAKRPNVIILSALGQEDIVRKCCELDVKYYMVKPFDANTLFERIRQFAYKKQVYFPTSKIQEERPAYQNIQREKSVNQLELEVSKLFHEMGIPAHFRGYAYLREAIIIAAREVEVLGNITKNLYPRIAEKYNSSSSGVESAIRHTIEIGWERGNSEFFEEFFGFENQKGRFPTTAAFIAKIADKLRLESKVV
jgi:two-component system response regulator (stage 0 sporulation protein A)